jgi:hypothetical protein
MDVYSKQQTYKNFRKKCFFFFLGGINFGTDRPKNKNYECNNLKRMRCYWECLREHIGNRPKKHKGKICNSYIVHWISLHVLGIYTFNIYYLLVDKIRNIFFFKYYWHKKIKYIVLNIVKHYIRYNTLSYGNFNILTSKVLEYNLRTTFHNQLKI